MLDFVFKGVAGCGIWDRICEQLFHQMPGKILFYWVSMTTVSRMPHVQVIRMLAPGVSGQEVSGDFVCLTSKRVNVAWAAESQAVLFSWVMTQ